MDLQKLAPCKYIEKLWKLERYWGKDGKIPHLPPYLQSCDFGMQMGHLSSLLQICSLSYSIMVVGGSEHNSFGLCTIYTWFIILREVA